LSGTYKEVFLFADSNVRFVGYDLISEPSLFLQNIPFKFNIYQPSLVLNPITDESFKPPLKFVGASFRFVSHK